MKRKSFCVIPARGGSERLPRKNLALLGGRPMIEYSIEAAQQSGCFDDVYVCTDDPEIAAVARGRGASVPILIPADLAGPLVPSHQPAQWLHEWLKSGADTLICLQPSSPLRSAADIQTALATFEDGAYDFLVSVTPIDPHYFHWAVQPEPEGRDWRMYFGDQFMQERPLLPPVHRPNGSIKIANFQALKRTGHFFGNRLGVTVTPEERSVHVAVVFDLVVAEALLAKGNNAGA